MIASVPAVAGEQPDGGFTPEIAPVLAQGFQQVLAEHDIAILAALATLHMNYVAGTIDVRDLEISQFGTTETRGLERHQQSALERRRSSFDEAVNFLPAEDGR